mgnify:CR=1 FL=1
MNRTEINRLVNDLLMITPCKSNRSTEKFEEAVRKLMSVSYQHFGHKGVRKVEEALLFAAEKHQGEYRECENAPYILHPISTALNLFKLGVFDKKCTIASVLHDVHEDEGVAIREITKKFGRDIAQIVHLVSKKHKGEFINHKNGGFWKNLKKHRNLNNRWRAIIIKFADRIHNISTFGNMEEKRLFRKVKETLDQFKELGESLNKAIQSLHKQGIIKDDSLLTLAWRASNRLHHELAPYRNKYEQYISKL